MNDDHYRRPEIPPPAPPFEPELPTGIRRRPRRRGKCAKSYLAENPVAACRLLRDLVKRDEPY